MDLDNLEYFDPIIDVSGEEPRVMNPQWGFFRSPTLNQKCEAALERAARPWRIEEIAPGVYKMFL